MTSKALRELPLRSAHEASGAQFAATNGWNLPQAYSGGEILEYKALREAAAITDRTDRTRLMVTGTDAVDVLDRVFDGHIRELDEGRSMKTFCVDGLGRVSDLITLSRSGGIAYLLEGEAGRSAATRDLLAGASEDDFDFRMDERSETTCSLAIIGPDGGKAVAKFVSPDVPRYLRPGHLLAFEFHGFRSSVTLAQEALPRFEFVLAPQVASHLWEAATSAGLAAAGFAATEIVRIEDGRPAWIPDLSGGATPEEAGLRPGSSQRSLKRLLIEGDQPLESGARVELSGATIGQVTSSIWSQKLDGTAALALIESSKATSPLGLRVAGRDATLRTDTVPS